MRVTAGVSLHKWTHTMSPSVLATCLMQIEVLAGEMLPPRAGFVGAGSNAQQIQMGQRWAALVCLVVNYIFRLNYR